MIKVLQRRCQDFHPDCIFPRKFPPHGLNCHYLWVLSVDLYVCDTVNSSLNNSTSINYNKRLVSLVKTDKYHYFSEK